MSYVEKEYYLNGALKSEVFVNNGKKEGIYREYYDNGISFKW